MKRHVNILVLITIIKLLFLKNERVNAKNNSGLQPFIFQTNCLIDTFESLHLQLTDK